MYSSRCSHSQTALFYLPSRRCTYANARTAWAEMRGKCHALCCKYLLKGRSYNGTCKLVFQLQEANQKCLKIAIDYDFQTLLIGLDYDCCVNKHGQASSNIQLRSLHFLTREIRPIVKRGSNSLSHGIRTAALGYWYILSTTRLVSKPNRQNNSVVETCIENIRSRMATFKEFRGAISAPCIGLLSTYLPF